MTIVVLVKEGTVPGLHPQVRFLREQNGLCTVLKQPRENTDPMSRARHRVSKLLTAPRSNTHTHTRDTKDTYKHYKLEVQRYAFIIWKHRQQQLRVASEFPN